MAEQNQIARLVNIAKFTLFFLTKKGILQVFKTTAMVDALRG
jgi:hypothetical protein